MKKKITGLARDYGGIPLDEKDVAASPFDQFRRWFDDAARKDPATAAAMALATATPGGVPSVRMVLLKDADESGFVFYTNTDSRKAKEIAQNSRGALLWYWPTLERQVRADGVLRPVPAEEAAAYFRTRPRESQLGAWASRQSEVIPDRAHLERAMRVIEERYRNSDVPPPPSWGGYRLVPDEVEFWQGRPGRLHDRLRYRRGTQSWTIDRLSP